MADATRYRTLEEQLKKQDGVQSKIQELLEGILKSQQNLEAKMEINDQKVSDRVTSLESQVQSILRKVNGKEKEPIPTANSQAMDRTPLLPTLTSKLRDDSDWTLWSERGSRNSWIPHPKIELPMFSGDNPREWIRKCQKYFMIYQISEPQKMPLIEMYLEGRAEIWYQGLKTAKGRLSWDEFVVEVTRRFNEMGFRDEVEEFNKLHQEGSVKEYQEKFEELKSLMLLKNPLLQEAYFISSFVSGAKEEIKPMLRLLKPNSLVEAFEIAAVQEHSVEVLNKKAKWSHKTLPEVQKSNSSGHSDGKSSWNSASKAKAKEGTEAKRLTPQEIQYRRNNHLCFKCGDKFSPNHQCKFANLNFVVMEEEDDEFEDAEGEQEEGTGNPGQEMEVSLYALSDSLKRKTISLQGFMNNTTVTILVDTGSSHSFITPALVKDLKLPS